MARSKIFGDPRTQSELDGPSLATEDEAPAPKVSWLGRVFRGVTNTPLPDHERARQLRKAVRSQDITRAQELLTEGVGVYEDQEASLGCIATRRADGAMLDLLIRAGVDINQADRRSRDHKSRTPLMEAARKGWEDGVDMLLAARANTEVADENGATALSLAVRGGKSAVVKMLLKAGANPNGTGSSDHPQLTPLHEAASEDVVDLLLAHSASVNVKDRQGFTPLHYHARAGRVGVVRRLLEAGSDINAKDRNNRTPIFMVGQKGDTLGTMETLVEAGAELDLLDREQNSFVHLVCARGEDPRVFERMAQLRPALFSKQNHVGETPRDILSVRGFRDIATRLAASEAERRRKGEFVAPERVSIMESAARLAQSKDTQS